MLENPSVCCNSLKHSWLGSQLFPGVISDSHCNLIPPRVHMPPQKPRAFLASFPCSLGFFPKKINRRIFREDWQEIHTMCTAKLCQASWLPDPFGLWAKSPFPNCRLQSSLATEKTEELSIPLLKGGKQMPPRALKIPQHVVHGAERRPRGQSGV